MAKISEPLLKILKVQTLLALILGLPLYFFKIDAALAVLTAAMVAVVPGLYTLLVNALPLEKGSTGIGRVVKAEIGKYCITISLLIGIFVAVEDLNPGIFFISLLIFFFSPTVLPFLPRLARDKTKVSTNN